MNKNWIIGVVVVVIVIIAVLAYKNKGSGVAGGENIVGCYQMHTGQDVYTMNIQSQNGQSVAGRMVFKNFEKDSSQGTFSGTYKNGILLGDYSFSSEGMNSVMQVIFKKTGNDFQRGYGDMLPGGTEFADLSKINYDPSDTLSFYEKTAGDCPTSL